jgi:uncharacterized oligopeptide transporter (OPT) family protein
VRETFSIVLIIVALGDALWQTFGRHRALWRLALDGAVLGVGYGIGTQAAMLVVAGWAILLALLIPLFVSMMSPRKRPSVSTQRPPPHDSFSQRMTNLAAVGFIGLLIAFVLLSLGEDWPGPVDVLLWVGAATSATLVVVPPILALRKRRADEHSERSDE